MPTCHTIRGTDAAGQVAPDLTHLATRSTLGAGTLSNTPEHLAAWIRDPQSVKPGNQMPPTPLSHEESAGTRGVPAARSDDPRPIRRSLAHAGTLERTWADPRGLVGWFCHVDHKSIGRRYLVTAFGFFLIGGVLAALMRLQLARPDNTFLGPDLYNQIFTTHGTTMMFLFAVPVMQGLGIYFVPLMVGARSIAFPRLVAFSYWMLLFGGIFLYVSFALNAGPDVGWFAYRAA